MQTNLSRTFLAFQRSLEFLQDCLTVWLYIYWWSNCNFFQFSYNVMSLSITILTGRFLVYKDKERCQFFKIFRRILILMYKWYNIYLYVVVTQCRKTIIIRWLDKLNQEYFNTTKLTLHGVKMKTMQILLQYELSILNSYYSSSYPSIITIRLISLVSIRLVLVQKFWSEDMKGGEIEGVRDRFILEWGSWWSASERATWRVLSFMIWSCCWGNVSFRSNTSSPKQV